MARRRLPLGLRRGAGGVAEPPRRTRRQKRQDEDQARNWGARHGGKFIPTPLARKPRRRRPVPTERVASEHDYRQNRQEKIQKELTPGSPYRKKYPKVHTTGQRQRQKRQSARDARNRRNRILADLRNVTNEFDRFQPASLAGVSHGTVAPSQKERGRKLRNIALREHRGEITDRQARAERARLGLLAGTEFTGGFTPSKFEEALGNFFMQGFQTAVGFGPGMVHLAMDPVGSAKAFVDDYKYRFGPLLDGDWDEFVQRALVEEPFFTALDAGALISGSARLGAGVSQGAQVAGRAGIRAGVKAGARQTFAEPIVRFERELRDPNSGEIVARPHASPNMVRRWVQHQYDRVTERYGPMVETRAKKNVKVTRERAMEREQARILGDFQRVVRKVQRNPSMARAYDILSKSYLNPEEALAFLADELAMREQRLADKGISRKEAVNQRQQISLLKSARHWVANPDRRAIRSPNMTLADVVRAGQEVQRRTDETRVGIGRLDPVTAEESRHRYVRHVEGFNLPEINHPVRDKIIAEASQYMDAETLEKFKRILDFPVIALARATDIDPNEAFSELFAGIGREAPEGALLQKLPSDMGELSPGRAFVEIADIYDRYAGKGKTFKALPTPVRSPEDLAGLVDELEGLAQTGAHGADWYKAVGENVARLSRGDGEMANRISKVIAVMSPRRAPRENIELAFRAINEHMATGKVPGGTGAGRARVQARQAQEILDGKRTRLRDSDSARKIESFWLNILKYADRDEYLRVFDELDLPRDPVTIDTWMRRAFRYVIPEKENAEKITPAMYEFMEDVVHELARRTGMEPEQVQAAIWTAFRERVPDSTKYDIPIDEAFNRSLAQVSFEAEQSSRAFPPAGVPEPVKRAFLRAKAPFVTRALNDLDVPGYVRNYIGAGVYISDGQVGFNPGLAVHMPAGKAVGAPKLDKASKKVLLEVASVIGYGLRQDSVGIFHSFRSSGIPQSRKNVALVTIGRQMTEDEVQSLRRTLDPKNREDIYFIHDEQGMHIFNGRGHLANRRFQDLVDEALAETFDDYRVSFKRGESELAGEWGTPYEQVFGRASRRADVRGSADRLRRQSDEVDADFAGRHGWDLPGDIDATVDPVTSRLNERLEFQSLEPSSTLFQEGTPPPWYAKELVEESAPRGAVSFSRDGATLYFGETADLSTFIHESAHVILRGIRDRNPELFKDIRAHLIGGKGNKLTRKQEERFARAVERFVREGEAPTPALNDAFREASSILKGIYHSPRALGELEEEGRATLRKVFDPTRATMASEDAFFMPSIADWGPRSLSKRKKGERNLRKLYKSHGILFTEGRFKFGPRVTAEHAQKVAKERVFLADQAEVRKHARALDEDSPDGLTSEEWTYFNPEGFRLNRRFREEGFGEEVEQMTAREILEEVEADYSSLVRNTFPGVDEYRALPQEMRRQVQQVPVAVRDAYFGGDFYMPSGGRTVTRFITEPLDMMNDITRLGALFLKGYIPVNFLGAEIFAVLQQGVWHPLNLRKAITWLSDISPETLRRLDQEVGAGPSLGLQLNESVIKPITRPVAEFSSKMADRLPRRTAILHELRKAGIKTEDQILDLLDDPSREHILNQIAETAENEMVKFRGLGDFERAVLTRAIFVYPWIKGATRYGINLPFDHPVRAGIMAHIGQEGWDYMEEVMGDIASFLRGNTPVGKIYEAGGEKFIRVVNPTSVTPIGTTAEVFSSLATLLPNGPDPTDLLGRSASDFIAPPLTTAVETLFGVDTFRKEPLPEGTNFFQRYIEDTARTFPAVRFAQTALGNEPESNYFRKMGVAGQAGRLVGGGLYPRDMNLTQARSSRQKELSLRGEEKKDPGIALFRDGEVTYDEWVKLSKRLARKYHAPIPQDVLRGAQLKDGLERSLKQARETKGDELTTKERAQAYSYFFSRRFPDASSRLQEGLARAGQVGIDEAYQEFIDELLNDPVWDPFHQWNAEVMNALEAEALARRSR